MKSMYVTKDEAYTLLAIAITRQAALDYRTEYIKSIEQGKPTEELKSLEEWFNTGFGLLCSMDCGTPIMEGIKKNRPINDEWGD